MMQGAKEHKHIFKVSPDQDLYIWNSVNILHDRIFKENVKHILSTFLIYS